MTGFLKRFFEPKKRKITIIGISHEVDSEVLQTVIDEIHRPGVSATLVDRKERKAGDESRFGVDRQGNRG